MNSSTARCLVNSFLVAAMLLVCTITTQGQTTEKKSAAQEKERLIDIITYREGLLKTPDPALSQHKHHDVVVYKAEADAIYGILYYLMENDTLRKAWWGLSRRNEEYDVAYYRWTDDTTLVLRLYNSETKKQKTVAISGTTKRSTAKID